MERSERPKRPAYSSGVTFLNCPSIQDDEIGPGMLVVGGVPCEFTGSAIGPRLGPEAIRSASVGIDWRWREPGPEGVIDVLDGSLVRFRDDLALGDVGDFTIYAPQLEPTTKSIRSRQRGIVARGAFPIMLGGDHCLGMGAITAVGGGTLRDALLGRVPVVLRSELYAIPALAGATVVVLSDWSGLYGVPAALGAAVLCFGIRILGVHFDLNAPRPPGTDPD